MYYSKILIFHFDFDLSCWKFALHVIGKVDIAIQVFHTYTYV